MPERPCLHLAGLLDSIDALYKRYNAFLSENGYGPKYGLDPAEMFVIQGMDKVREVIEKNRARKLTKHKKLSNNTVIEIQDRVFNTCLLTKNAETA